jgi:lysophospholipase L1-like esterase
MSSRPGKPLHSYFFPVILYAGGMCTLSSLFYSVEGPFSYAQALTCLLAYRHANYPRAHTAALAASQQTKKPSVVGPKQYYLALGDSLAFGFQPDLNFDNGYTTDFFNNLRGHGTKHIANMACPGETSVTFLNGKCPYPFLRKYPYTGSQMNAALKYLHLHAGKVSPVTLDIGANDVLGDINSNNCSINQNKFNADLATLDANLTQTILPELHAALTIKGQVTGDLILMNYYDPYQNICPKTVPAVQLVNQHLANDVSDYGSIVDVFSAFGGPHVPNHNICKYTWMCSIFTDIHATNKGYGVIAKTFEQGYGY